MSATVSAVSIVIPVKNGIEFIPSLCAALKRLDPAPAEVIAIDSESNDGSAFHVASAGFRVISIRASDFDHGLTRQMGVAAAKSPFVAFLSQDAEPVGSDYLDRLTAPMRNDDAIAGVSARQIARPGADPRTRCDIALSPMGGTIPRVGRGNESSLAESPSARHLRIAFDNVASCVRRDLAMKLPFESTRFGEDIAWGARVIDARYALAFEPAAVVLHSHQRTARALYRRSYLSHRILKRLAGLKTIPDARHWARAAAITAFSDLRLLSAARRFDLFPTVPAQAVCATLGQWWGARDEDQGRAYPAWA